ncbi:MAG: putative toxin-antitoxin system toxin component, PIN family [Phycisphaerae bacterium]|nr:putative toxin-antitoxin system toxin component, PIN family [Phycisphaerae bacterium]
MKVVLDTNVLLSGLFVRGLCETVLDVCVSSEGCTLILSEHILNEFERHARKTFHAPAGDVRKAMKFLRDHAELVTPVKVPAKACRDADDLPVLGTLEAGKADCLVTGDKDLLALNEFQGRPILSPRQFYEHLK